MTTDINSLIAEVRRLDAKRPKLEWQTRDVFRIAAPLLCAEVESLRARITALENGIVAEARRTAALEDELRGECARLRGELAELRRKQLGEVLDALPSRISLSAAIAAREALHECGQRSCRAECRAAAIAARRALGGE